MAGVISKNQQPIAREQAITAYGNQASKQTVKVFVIN